MTDEAYESRKAAHTLLERRESNDGPKADVLYQGVSRLKWLADNPDWWTATYVTAHIIVDKDGEIDRLVRAIIERGGDAAFAKVPEAYDSYLNSFVRSLKSWRCSDELGGRFMRRNPLSTCYLLCSASSDHGRRISTRSP